MILFLMVQTQMMRQMAQKNLYKKLLILLKKVMKHLKNHEKKAFLNVLTRIFATLLNIKEDNVEKTLSLIKSGISTAVRSWTKIK